MRYLVEDPDKSRCKPLPKSLFLSQLERVQELENDFGAMGVRVPIEGPLDLGKFPLSKSSKVKELLADADNILVSC